MTHVNLRNCQITVVQGDQFNVTIMDQGLQPLRSRISLGSRYNSGTRCTPPCEPGTRVEILEEIFQWVPEPGNHSIYSLYGSAGSGKSAIAQSVSEYFAKRGGLAASFFFSSQEEERCNLERVVPTIAYQLAIANPIMGCHICNLLRDDTILDLLFEDQLQKLIIELLELLPPPSDHPSVVVIDALDGCQDYDKIVQLMMRLADSTSEPRFSWRFFVTSRHNPAIRNAIEDLELNPPHLRCDLTQSPADFDIRLFFEHKFEEIRKAHSTLEFQSLWPSSDQLDKLVVKSSGLFIYASTVIKFIAERGRSFQTVGQSSQCPEQSSVIRSRSTLHTDPVYVFCKHR